MLDCLEQDLDSNIFQLSDTDLKKLLMLKGILIAKVRLAEKLAKWLKL